MFSAPPIKDHFDNNNSKCREIYTLKIGMNGVIATVQLHAKIWLHINVTDGLNKFYCIHASCKTSVINTLMKLFLLRMRSHSKSQCLATEPSIGVIKSQGNLHRFWSDKVASTFRDKLKRENVFSGKTL
jgi:hypothetical protein